MTPLTDEEIHRLLHEDYMRAVYGDSIQRDYNQALSFAEECARHATSKRQFVEWLLAGFDAFGWRLPV